MFYRDRTLALHGGKQVELSGVGFHDDILAGKSACLDFKTNQNECLYGKYR
jgi:hypothetical protein